MNKCALLYLYPPNSLCPACRTAHQLEALLFKARDDLATSPRFTVSGLIMMKVRSRGIVMRWQKWTKGRHQDTRPHSLFACAIGHCSRSCLRKLYEFARACASCWNVDKQNERAQVPPRRATIKASSSSKQIKDSSHTCSQDLNCMPNG